MSEQILKIGNYLLLEKLASGGMAEVYLAKTISSDKFLAIKKILPNYTESLEFLSQFKEEIRVSLNLNHSNIVSFFDVVVEHGQLYLVMELVNGVNLRQFGHDVRFTKSNLELPYILHVISEVAAGLDYAHRSVDIMTHQKLNIIHRDINPHNIMVTFDGNVKIIDFGIAKADAKADVTKIGMLKGKFSYMAPEQADGSGVDARTDVFALGILFWELLTGERLYAGRNDINTLLKIKNEPIQRPSLVNPDIAPELEAIVMKALEKKPADRYQNISDLKFEIDRFNNEKFSKFRKAHFSDFTNQLYSDVIKARSEKLVYYSKIKANQLQNPKAFVPKILSENENTESRLKIELPEGFETKSVPRVSEKYDFDALPKANPFAAEVKVHQKKQAAQFFPDKKKLDYSEPSYSSFPSLKTFLLLGLILYSARTYYKDNYDEVDEKDVASVTETSTPATSTDSAQPVATPATRLVASKQDDFSAMVYKKLKASAKLAYANIYVTNSRSSDIRIFVNGKEIFEKAPVKMYPIYANQQTRITAYSKKLNAADEKKIIIPAGKTMNIKLFLRPYSKSK